MALLLLLPFTLTIFCGEAANVATCNMAPLSGNTDPVAGMITFKQDDENSPTTVKYMNAANLGAASTYELIILSGTSCNKVDSQSHFGVNGKDHGTIGNNPGGNFHNGDLGDVTAGQEFTKAVHKDIFGLHKKNSILGKAMSIKRSDDTHVGCCVIEMSNPINAYCQLKTLANPGSDVGTITMSQKSALDETVFNLPTEAKLPKGTGELIILARGSCDGDDIDGAAHFQESGRQHGDNPSQGHKGDLGSVTRGNEWAINVAPEIFALRGDNDVIDQAIVFKTGSSATACCVITKGTPPTTKAPTTKKPTKKAPKTKKPRTKAPKTKAPRTKKPTTKAPTTKAPTTKAPKTIPVTTNPTPTKKTNVASKAGLGTGPSVLLSMFSVVMGASAMKE